MKSPRKFSVAPGVASSAFVPAGSDLDAAVWACRWFSASPTMFCWRLAPVWPIWVFLHTHHALPGRHDVSLGRKGHSGELFLSENAVWPCCLPIRLYSLCILYDCMAANQLLILSPSEWYRIAQVSQHQLSFLLI